MLFRSRPANLLTLSTQGTYLPTRELLKRIAATPRSSPVTIINTSSIGSTNTRPGMSSYQSSKSTINRFTEFLSYEYPETVRTFACVLCCPTHQCSGLNRRIQIPPWRSYDQACRSDAQEHAPHAQRQSRVGWLLRTLACDISVGRLSSGTVLFVQMGKLWCQMIDRKGGFG